MDLNAMDIRDLKVAAYDILGNIEQLQNGLRDINVAIAHKIQENQENKEKQELQSTEA